MKTFTLSMVLLGVLIGLVATPPGQAATQPAVIAMTVTGSLTAAQSTVAGPSTACGSTACVVMPLHALVGSVAWEIIGTWSATLQFEGTVDNVNWYGLAALPPGSTSTSRIAIVSTAANGIYQMNAAGLAAVRVRCSAFSSGPVAIIGKRSGLAPPSY
jgi:hypothetical protein